MASKPATACAKPSKHNMLLKLLRSKNGATIGEMQKATEWQPHSIRGFMSGTVKKKLRLTVTSTVSSSGQRKYAIARQ